MGLTLIQPVCRSYELTLPNKLFEYAAAGLPILSSDLPVIGPLVAAEQLGEVVPAGVGDARGLPFETHNFDVVTMFTVLSSLASSHAVEVALGEARRVLRPGGMLMVWEPRLPTPLNHHTLRISDRLLRRTLAETRIQARTITLMPPLARRLGGSSERLYPMLARVPALRTHRLICATVPGGVESGGQ